MIQIDEKALEAAVRAVQLMEVGTTYSEAETAIAAYLAALPPPTGESQIDEFVTALMTNYISELVKRLRGEYRIPIKDGLGAAGGDEPDNANEYVRHFPTTPIQLEAADALTALSARIAECEEKLGAEILDRLAAGHKLKAATARARRRDGAGAEGPDARDAERGNRR